QFWWECQRLSYDVVSNVIHPNLVVGCRAVVVSKRFSDTPNIAIFEISSEISSSTQSLIDAQKLHRSSLPKL
ncbi:MAG TPA: hypothetical protein VK666_04615, partial [Chryseolinea sp.]|nr:hypothetical protein [Chryseolinea sp.]